MKWISIHIYYNSFSDFNRVLLDVVDPVIQKCFGVKTFLTSKFFFVRYWDEEMGYHIRLRLLVNNKDFAIEFLDTEISKFSEKLQYRFLPYNPEISRYGGENNIEKSERHFHYSSITCISILKRIRKEYSKQIINTSINYHVIMALGFGLDKKEISLFFKVLFQNWAIHSMSNEERSNIENSLSKRAKSYLEKFTPLIKIISTNCYILIKSCLTGDFSFTKEYESWFLMCNKIKLETLNSINVEQIHASNPVYINKDERVNYKSQWLLFNSFAHMFNNRLGIINEDEALIFFLISEAINRIDEYNSLDAE